MCSGRGESGEVTVAGQRCEQAGCRAWARRGQRRCAAHLRPAAPAGGSAAEADRTRGGTDEPAPPARLAVVVGQLEAGATAGLSGEIAAARLALARLLREEDDPVRLADGLAKAAGVVLRAWQLEHPRGEPGAALADLSAQVLAAMGLGERPDERATPPAATRQTGTAADREGEAGEHGGAGDNGAAGDERL
jgi:hypothetical protein